jgi:uncharacterized protein YbjT (DUF2867 family)
VRWPYARAARSLIHERDIAAVAVRCLTGGHADGDGGHGDVGHGGVHVLTGPEAVTQEEQVRAIGRAVGRPVRYEEIPADAALTQMLADGWPRPFAEHALAHWETLVEQPEPVTDTVERLTGTAARTFGEWARDHADDFR